MIQFYFLSIFFNVLAGYILISNDDADTLEIRPGFSLKDETVKLTLGILGMVTGILKLLSPIEGDLPILGDIIPAVIGFFAGFILVIEYYKGHASIESEDGEGFGQTLIRNKKIIGYVAIAVAALHFQFPTVLLL
jgi:hypothetical protein